MPSAYSPLLRIELQATGENDTTWGDKTNANFQNVVEAAIAGLAPIVMTDADKTLTVNSGVPDEARSAILLVTGTLTAARSIIVPNTSKTYVVKNSTTGGFPVTVKTSGGTGVAVVNGAAATVWCDGNNKVELAQSPTADSSITPIKIDPTATYAWRFNGALGLNRTQAHVPNYGAFSLDGTTGSYISFYQGGSQIGTLSAATEAFDLSSPGKPITFTTNGIKRVTIENTGEVKVAGALTAVSFSAAGAGLFNSLGVTSNVTVGGTVSASGFVGITASNIASALGYSPIAQGSGNLQNPSYAIKIGWSPVGNRLRAQVENTDLGNIVFDNTAGVFIPVAGAKGVFQFASPSSGSDPLISAPIVLRETNYGGSLPGGGELLAPRLGFVWNGRGDGAITMSASTGVAIPTFTFYGAASSGAKAQIRGYSAIFDDVVVQNASDMRLKDRLGDITDAAKKLRTLPAFYYMNNDVANEMGLTDDSVQIGWSAQKVKEVFPELVRPAPVDTDAEGNSKSGQYYMTLIYERAVPILGAAINEHTDTLEKLSLENQRLHDSITVLMNRIAALENK